MGYKRLATGTVITFRENPYSRDYFGCQDIANAMEAVTLEREASNAAVRGGALRYRDFGARAVERFVIDHRVDHDFTNVCTALREKQYKIADTFDFGPHQLVCMEPTDRKAKQEGEGCWWTALGIPPSISRPRF
jgi:hypothetical protein